MSVTATARKSEATGKASPTVRVTMGIDAAMVTTGYSILQNDRLVKAGRITTKASDPEPVRVAHVFRELLAVMQENGVTEVALEQFKAFYTSDRPGKSGPADSGLSVFAQTRERKGEHDRKKPNPSSMFLMKAAQTAAQMAAIQHGADLYLYPVAEWKGDSRMSKDQIRQRVALVHGVSIKDHNVSDAVAIATYHVQYGRLQPGRCVRTDPLVPALSEAAG